MTNMENTVGPVLKTDGLGRVKTPLERRERLLEEFERSGLSGVKFAQLAGVKYPTFASWLAQRRKQAGSPQAPVKAVDSVRWLEAVVSEAQSCGPKAIHPLKVHLAAGAWMELADPDQVSLAAALIQALGKSLPGC